MSFWDTAERPDYEEPDNTISYTLSFVDGQDSVQVEVSYPGLNDGEIQVELTDPALMAALHAACQGLIHDHFKAQDEEREHRRIEAAEAAEYLDMLNQSL